MGILIGMDEAGYGPNLGPLVVAASAWEAESGKREGDPLSIRDLYDALRDVVTREACTDGRVAIADSKRLYRPGLGLRQLERGVLAALGAMGLPAARWSDIVDALAADPAGHHGALPWHADFDCRLPIDASADEVAALGLQLGDACSAAGVRPLAIRARLVFPAEFNELVEYHGTKATALSHVTIGLLRNVMETVQLGCANVVCDKHGGRNRYQALLQHHFAEHWIEPILEGSAESRYAWGPADSRVSVSFRAGGEAFLPTALASMTAKYLRELSMRAFNGYWCARVPDLRPTAGYPVDARRFKVEIETVQRELGMDDCVLWRSR
jgi:ribonuclease HII